MNSFEAHPVDATSSSPNIDFLPLYPVIQRHARIVFRHLSSVEREEAVAEAVAAGFCSFVALKKRGKDPSAFPHALATYAARRVRDGRRVGSKLNSRDVLSKAAQQRRGFDLVQLPAHQFDELLIDDTITPIADQVAFRIDWKAFLRRMSSRHRRIVHYLAMGHAAKWVAHELHLSPGRITQLRQQWKQQWRAFTGESTKLKGFGAIREDCRVRAFANSSKIRCDATSPGASSGYSRMCSPSEPA
jgi:DNA-binding NarL/FixJ family response regulator